MLSMLRSIKSIHRPLYVRGWSSDNRLSSLLDTPFDTDPSHSELRHMIRQFVSKEVEPQAGEFNRLEKLNLPLLKKLGDLGLFGLTIREEDGGSGMDATSVVIAHEELSASDPSLCLSYLAHSLLLVNNFYDNASPSLKQQFLPRMLSGELIGGMGMSEPGAGTDVLGMKTKAIKDGKTYSITGSKMWITNGCFDDQTLGDIFLIYAKTDSKHISLFLVPKETPGFSLGQKIKDKLGMRSSATAELVLQNATIPQSFLIGEINKGVIPMMKNLEIERVALAAMGLGISRRCLEVMIQYSKDRQAFGKPISEFGQIQSHIANSFAQYQAARSYVYRVASQLSASSQVSSSSNTSDQHRTLTHTQHNRSDSDAVKVIASRAAKDIADRAIQVLGGNGYVGEYVVERLWRDAKLLEIGGGTIEAHQKNIAKDLVHLVSK